MNKLAKMLFSCRYSGGDSIFQFYEGFTENRLLVNLKLSNPSFVSIVPAHSLIAAFVVFSTWPIVNVLASGSCSKLFPSAVSTIAFNMVNFWRKLFSHIDESQPVCVSSSSIYFDNQITLGEAFNKLTSPSLIPSFRNIGAPTPAPLSGFWIVAQDGSKIALGDILKIGHGLLPQIVARVAQLQLGDPPILAWCHSDINLGP
jgi:hypothetical protein